MRFIITYILLNCILITSSLSQNISGTIVDEEGNFLIGVVVSSTDDKIITISDTIGSFNINSSDVLNDSLVFTYLGMLPLKCHINDIRAHHVVMKEDNYSFDDVVVVGYGTSKKSDITGVISSLSGDKLLMQNATSLSQLLSGHIVGLRVQSSDGMFNADSKITIRGGGSITQENNPLIIVDGFPVESIDDIPPSEIESINVLKDASASSIYGSRGANGVIIITTKKSNADNFKLSYNSRYGIRHLSKKINTLSVYDYLLLQYELANSDSDKLLQFERSYGVFEDLELYKNIVGEDWQDKIFGREAFFMSQNISLSGGNTNYKYRVNYNFDDNNGVMIGSNMLRHNVGINIEAKITDRIKFEIISRYNNKVVNGAGTVSEGTTTSGRLRNAIVYRPISPNEYVANEDRKSVV